ncbi:CoA-binding protein [Enemella dayhoffiae]|uniref:CoA-binding protein n=1 Tax=Enemella dayhoffiae TaxID=2016507 RepID=UPI0026B8CBB1
MTDPASLAPLLTARAIAVVGASANPYKPSGRTLRYLRRYGFPGKVFGVTRAGGRCTAIPVSTRWLSFLGPWTWR